MFVFCLGPSIAFLDARQLRTSTRFRLILAYFEVILVHNILASPLHIANIMLFITTFKSLYSLLLCFKAI